MLIQNKPDKVSANFQMNEFWGGTDFELPDNLINAAQVIRDYFGFPIRITSTYRPKDTFGYHRYGMAIDMVAANPTKSTAMINAYNNELLNYNAGQDSVLISGLRKTGITGFGIENVCCHLDVRNQNKCNKIDEYGKYLIFIFEMQNGKIIKNYSL